MGLEGLPLATALYFQNRHINVRQTEHITSTVIERNQWKLAIVR